MKILAIVFVAVLAAASGYIFLKSGDRDVRPSTAAPATTAVESTAALANAPITGAQNPTAVSPPVESETGKLALAQSDFGKRFRAATDYLEYSKSILAAAREGNRDAQFYLYSALQFCEREYGFFFRKGTSWLTLDEALQKASTRPPQNIDDVQEVYDKCHSMHDADASEFGNAFEWLAKATTAGQPVALATTASRTLVNDESPQAKLDASAGRTPQDLLAEAVKSKDPQVLWTIGELQVALRGYSAETMKSQWAWWLVACERGFDCSASSPWYRFSCRVDQLCQPGETAVDYIRRSTQADFPDIEERAKEINAKLNAGDWDSLGIRS